MGKLTGMAGDASRPQRGPCQQGELISTPSKALGNVHVHRVGAGAQGDGRAAQNTNGGVRTVTASSDASMASPQEPHDFSLHYHHLQFELACYKRRGDAFQTFFEEIMLKHDSTFISVKPSGREGDWKCDGFSQRDGTVFQCYAPDELTTSKYIAKIKEDFAGASVYWERDMRRWVFVCSSQEALPPQMLDTLLELGRNNPDIEIAPWSRETLWRIVQQLTPQQRVELLGPVPQVTAAAETTAAEVASLLEYLVRQQPGIDVPESFDLTALADKLDRNHLTNAVRAWVQTALPVAKLVEDYTRRHPDIEFSSLVARSLAAKYQDIKENGNPESDVIFGALVDYIARGQRDPRLQWAAAGIVTHYFELCEVFER